MVGLEGVWLTEVSVETSVNNYLGTGWSRFDTFYLNKLQMTTGQKPALNK